METGRRFGNQVGDALAPRPTDVRGYATAQGYIVRDMQPTGPWAGHILAYANGRKAGAFSSNPFFLPSQAGRRVFFDFFLAGKNNAGEDVARYLRSIPADRVQLQFTRAHLDGVAFRIYHTAGITATPGVLLTTARPIDRVTGTLTAAVMRYMTEVLPAGGHSFQIRPVDTAGNEKTGCAVLTTVLAPWPAPPTGVQVHAHNSTTGLVTVKWSHAADYASGSKYLLYRNTGQDTRIRYGTAVKSATHPVAVTGSPSKPYATFTLPAVGAAAVGTWVAAVRHQRSGITEDNFSALARFQITQGGTFVPGGYPNAPSYLEAKPRAAARILLLWKHDAEGESNETLRFKVYRSPGNVSTVSYATAVATVTRTPGRLVEHTASLVLTNGQAFRFVVRSEATAGTRETNTTQVVATADATPPTSCPASVTLTKVLG